jgi:hypothetical protein
MIRAATAISEPVASRTARPCPGRQPRRRNGEPTLRFADTGGKRRIVLNLDLYGTLLQFADEAGKLRAALAVPAEGEPEMELLGRDDKVLWRAP